MRILISLKILVTTIIFLVFIYPIFGQTVQTVQTENGEIIQKIPYGKPFRFIGKALDKFNMDYDLINVKIFEITKRRAKECKDNQLQCIVNSDKPFYQNFWVKPTKNTSLDFNLLIGKPLHFSKNYYFEFTFYRAKTFSKEDVIASVNNLTKDYIEANSTNISNLSLTVRQRIIEDIKEKFDIQDSLWRIKTDLSNNFTDGHKLELESIQLPVWLTSSQSDGLVYNVGGKIVSESIMKNLVSILDEKRKDIRYQFGGVNKNETIAHLNGLQKILITDSISNFIVDKGGLKDGKGSNLSKNQYLSQMKESVAVINDFLVDQKETDKLKDSRLLLQNVTRKIKLSNSNPVLYGFFLDANRLISSYINTRNSIDRELKNIHDYNSVIEEVSDSISGIYFSAGRADNIVMVSSLRNLDSEKVKADILTFGVGPSLLNPTSSEKDLAPIGYIAARYYFYQLDKGLISQPYISDAWYHKSSVFFGLLPSIPITYKGTDLDKLVFNIHPVFGVGVDLNRFFTVDFGLIGFRQKNPHPLINETQARFAPFISINLGLDLFNKINKGVTGNDYKI